MCPIEVTGYDFGPFGKQCHLLEHNVQEIVGAISSYRAFSAACPAVDDAYRECVLFEVEVKDHASSRFEGVAIGIGGLGDRIWFKFIAAEDAHSCRCFAMFGIQGACNECLASLLRAESECFGKGFGETVLLDQSNMGCPGNELIPVGRR